MAKGGSGDVLGGMILGLLGQLAAAHKNDGKYTGNSIRTETIEQAQKESSFLKEAGRMTALAVYLHGLAGDLARTELGEYGMLPSDLTARIPAAILELQKNQLHHF